MRRTPVMFIQIIAAKRLKNRKRITSFLLKILMILSSAFAVLFFRMNLKHRLPARVPAPVLAPDPVPDPVP